MPLVPFRVAAQQLGCHPEHLRRLARAGLIPVYKISARNLRVDVNELRELFRANATATATTSTSVEPHFDAFGGDDA